MAFFGGLAAVHLRPVLIDDRIGVGVGLELELHALLFGEACGEAVDVSESASLEVHVEIRCAEVSPHGVEHEAENDRVGGTDDVKLPSYEVVVCLTLLAGPDAVQCGHEKHRGGNREDKSEDVQRRAKHGSDVLRTISKLIEFSALDDWFDGVLWGQIGTMNCTES